MRLTEDFDNAVNLNFGEIADFLISIPLSNYCNLKQGTLVKNE